MPPLKVTARIKKDTYDVMSIFNFLYVYQLIFMDITDSSDLEMPEREQATALLMAGRHLPDAVMQSTYHRVGLITEASRMYEALGDKKSVQMCRMTLLEIDNISQQANEISLQC